MPGGILVKTKKSGNRVVVSRSLSRSIWMLSIVGFVVFALALLCLLYTAVTPLVKYVLFVALALLLGVWLAAVIAMRKRVRELRDVEALVSAAADDAGPCRDLYNLVQNSMEAKQELSHLQCTMEKQLEKLTLQSCVRDTYVAIEQVENRLDMDSPYLMVYVHVEFAEHFRREVRELGKTTFFLKELIALYLENFEDDATVFQIESDQIVFVVSSTAEIERILLMLQDKLDSESEYANFTFVVSEVHSPRDPIKEVYDRLSGIAKYRIPGSKTRVLRESPERIRTERTVFDGDLKADFMEALQHESIDFCIHYIDRVLDRCVERGGGGVELQLLCSEISVTIDELLGNLFSSIPEELGSLNTCLKFAQVITPEQYKKVVGDYIKNAVTYLRLHRRTEDHIIGFILDYVEKHYDEDIYLNLFAEKLQLTAAYISSYFKEKMNVNLSDYINHFRIQKAIHLMETTVLKNKDIAVQVGLPNINTFIRLFKKHAGTTPGEYRKYHLAGE